MKKLILFALLSCQFIHIKAQQNKLSDQELFEGIKFENVSLGKIMDTNGDLTLMKNLYGDSLVVKVDTSSPFLAKFISTDKISFGFEDESESGNDYNLAFIVVRSQEISVQVKDLNVRLGDDKSKFADLLFNQKFNGYIFTDNDTGTTSLSFELDDKEKVSSIRFIGKY